MARLIPFWHMCVVHAHVLVSVHMCACTCVWWIICIFPSCLLCIHTVRGLCSQRSQILFVSTETMESSYRGLAPGANHPPWKVLEIKKGEWSFPDLCDSYFIQRMTLWMWLWISSVYAVLHIISHLFFTSFWKQ